MREVGLLFAAGSGNQAAESGNRATGSGNKAAENGNEDKVRSLIADGVNVNCKDGVSSPPKKRERETATVAVVDAWGCVLLSLWRCCLVPSLPSRHTVCALGAAVLGGEEGGQR